MAKIIGTKRADSLFGTEGADLIRGRARDDTIFGNGGQDRLYGDLGNDQIVGSYDRVEIYGGKGDDTISFYRGLAYGGVGNDRIGVWGGGWAIGGKGDDYLEGTGYLCGDEAPGLPERVAGNDRLHIIADADTARGRGGLGNDQFVVITGADDNYTGIGIVEDFKPGEDKFAMWYRPPDIDAPIDMFQELDANRNGVLEWSDSLSGGNVWVDAASNTMILASEGRDYFAIIHGTTQLSHATDWLV